MKFVFGWYIQRIHVEAKSIAITVKNDCAGAVYSIIQGIHVAQLTPTHFRFEYQNSNINIQV